MMLDNKHKYVSWIRTASINAGNALCVSKESEDRSEILVLVGSILICLGDSELDVTS
jgi:hypothetical protein